MTPEQLVEKNIRLAYWFAKKQTNSVIGYESALSIALEALWEAANTWDKERNFGTYASVCIKHALIAEAHIQKRQKRGYGMEIFSLDVNSPETDLALKQLCAVQEDEGIDSKVCLSKVLPHLNPAARRLISLWLTCQGNQAEMGRRLNLSKQRISQKVRALFPKMRRLIRQVEEQA